MQVSSPLIPGHVAAPVANPKLDAIVREQGRFRIEGTGPIAQRRIVPVSDGAQQLLDASRAGTLETVRGVLRLVEQAAGGAEASASVVLHGVAFADSRTGHGANEYQSYLDDDHAVRTSMARLRGRSREEAAASLGERTLAGAGSTRANAVAGWINLGPTASAAVLSARGVTIAGFDGHDENGLAEAVRILRHEAQHVVDATRPNLAAPGVTGLREALAEANSRDLPTLMQARAALGLAGAVSDAALGATLSLRPYPEHERAFDAALRAAGIEPGTAQARQLAALPSARVAETLVAGVAQARGTSTRTARSAIAAEFAAGRSASA